MNLAPLQNSRSGALAARVLGLAALAVALPLSACVTEGPPMKEPPRPTPAQPANLTPAKMVFSIANFATDTNQNGYVDTFEATVYLFAQGYDIAIAVPGSFAFTLTDRRGKVLMRWTMTAAQSAASVRQMLPGPGYSFQLSLTEAGTDQYESQVAEMSCEFIPATGQPIRSKGALSVQIGKIRS